MSDTPPSPVIGVTHALGAYEIHVGAGLLERLMPMIAATVPARNISLITDTVVGRHYEAWESGASGAWRPDGAASPCDPPHDWYTRLSVPAGESSKSRERWFELTDALLDQGLGRDSGIVAIGGGVVGDLAGFVAATYMRGVPLVQVPTTLLAMIDSAVGGKTGIDVRQGKNLIGAFHPPALVVADVCTLRTLPDAELRHGLAEAIKHGLVADAAYFDWIEGCAGAILARELATLTELVRRGVAIKAAVVEQDERESGRRAILNAGHTVAHAIEHVTHYATPHGQAVAIGLVAEAQLAVAVGLAPAELPERVRALLERVGLPARLPRPLPVEPLLHAMRLDKKARNQRIRFALPTTLGTMAGADDGWTVPVEESAIRGVLATLA